MALATNTYSLLYLTLLQHTSQHLLWLNGLIAFMTTWLCLSYYRTRAEVCFYCKWMFVVSNSQCFVLTLGQEHWPWLFFGVWFVASMLVVFAT